MHCFKSRFQRIVKNSIYMLAVMGWGAQVSSTELEWHTVSPPPSTEHLMGIANGNGKYVAVGFTGAILTSPDGTVWTDNSVASDVTFYGVCAKDGLFVAVGAAGTVVTSPDGSTWITRSSIVTEDLKSVAWNGTRFVAVGPSKTVITSENGEEWTQQTFESDTDLNAVAWGNNMFVAVGFDGMEGTVNTSPDGIVWSGSANYGSEGLFSVAWCNTQFIAASYPMYSSTDGSTWSEVSAETNEQYIVSVAAATNQIVAVGGSGTVVSSPDGSTWTMSTSGVIEYLNSVTSDGTSFVAVGMNGTIIYSSTSNSVGQPHMALLNKPSFDVKGMTAFYTVAGNEDVTMALYSLQGKHIKSLVNGNVPKGSHQIAFSQGVSAGKYILRMKTPTLLTQQIVEVMKE